MMMGANLVGFVIGTEGLQFFVGELFGTAQGAFLGVQLIRENSLLVWFAHQSIY